jgi:hypothetical protein
VSDDCRLRSSLRSCSSRSSRAWHLCSAGQSWSCRSSSRAYRSRFCFGSCFTKGTSTSSDARSRRRRAFVRREHDKTKNARTLTGSIHAFFRVIRDRTSRSRAPAFEDYSSLTAVSDSGARGVCDGACERGCSSISPSTMMLSALYAASPVPAGMRRPMMTFSLRPRSVSVFP